MMRRMLMGLLLLGTLVLSAGCGGNKSVYDADGVAFEIGSGFGL